MSEVEIQLPGFTAKFEFQGGGWGELSHEPTAKFFELLWLARAAVAVTDLTLHRLPGTDPVEFRYRITVSDGRVWTQHMRFDVGLDPGVSFTVPDYWRLSEYRAFLELRQEVVALHNKYDLEKISVTINGVP